jgi:hypothetical protein
MTPVFAARRLGFFGHVGPAKVLSAPVIPIIISLTLRQVKRLEKKGTVLFSLCLSVRLLEKGRGK